MGLLWWCRDLSTRTQSDEDDVALSSMLWRASVQPGRGDGDDEDEGDGERPGGWPLIRPDTQLETAMSVVAALWVGTEP